MKIKKVSLYILFLTFCLTGCQSPVLRPFILYKQDEIALQKEDFGRVHEQSYYLTPFPNTTTLRREDLALKQDKTFYSTPVIEDKNTKLEITSKELRLRKTF